MNLPPDPTAAGAGLEAEWLFKKGGQVFGPVPQHVLLKMLYAGEIGAATPVSREDGTWRALGEVSALIVHVKKAEAQARGAAEVPGARLLRRRRHAIRVALFTVLGVVLLGGGIWGAFRLAVDKPWQRRSALLEDFGGGIAVAVPARIGGSRRAEAQEVEVPDEPRAPDARRGPARPRGAAPSGTAAGGDLVTAQYDTGHIQAVVAREQRTLATCLRAEAQRSPDFAGDLPLEFAIGNDGRVARLWIDSPRFKRGELHDCLLRTLRAWSFKPFPGERPTVTLTFRVGAR